MENPDGSLWTIEEVATYCKVKTSVIKYWMYNAGLPYIKLGKYARFDSADVKDWVNERKNGQKSRAGELRRII